jgi:hypothetical protein
VSFAALSPSNSVGNASTIFNFQLTYGNVDSVNLQSNYVVLSYTGTASCNSSSIISAQSLTPSLNITNCTGDGTLKIVLSPGTGTASDGTGDSGAVSFEATVDNTVPTVLVGSPSPSSGGSITNFDFPVTFLGSDTVNLSASEIIVNDGGGGTCDTPVVSGGSTTTPSVRLSNCMGNGTIGISINANASTDLAGNSNLTSSASSTVAVSSSVFCPTGYIPVAGNVFYGTSDFCVMKYEAKLLYDSDGDGDFSNAAIVSDGNFINTYDYDTDYESPSELVKYKAVSEINGRPWVRLKRGENGSATGQGALEACDRLNTQEGVSSKYDIISNAEWQTIARDIAAQQSGGTNNWGLDFFGQMIINHGHIDNSPGHSCDASHVSVDTDCADTGEEDDFAEKRTHNLSNSEVIWDLAGNVWEWVKDNNTTTLYKGSFQWDFWTDWTDANSDGISDSYSSTQDLFGPLDLTPALCTYPGVINRCGFGYFFDDDAGAVIRGGQWNNVSPYSGVFSATLSVAPSSSGDNFGFRCVFHP